MNILIPMAGRGSRFKKANFSLPKPLININGKSMIELVIDNLDQHTNDKFIFLVRDEHVTNYGIDDSLRAAMPNCEIVIVDHITEGAACTCLLAKHLINNDEELLIANCDQLMVWNRLNFNTLKNLVVPDGIVFIFESTSPNNSYVKIDDNFHIKLAIEKRVISNHATCGVYYWKRGEDFIESANRMIAANERFRAEFYVCPTYNYLIQDGKVIVPFFTDKHYPIGTPEDLQSYLSR